MANNRLFEEPVTRHDIVQASKAVHDKLVKDVKDTAHKAAHGMVADLQAELKALDERHERRYGVLLKRLEDREGYWQQKLLEANEALDRALATSREEYRKGLAEFRELVKSLPAQSGLEGDAGAAVLLRVSKMLSGEVGALTAAVKACEGRVEEMRQHFDGGLGLVTALAKALPPPQIAVTVPELRAPDVVVNVPAPNVQVDVKPAEIPAPVVNNILPDLNLPAPVVNVAAPEVKTLPAPEVKVIVPRKLVKKTFQYYDDGRPASVVEEEITREGG